MLWVYDPLRNMHYRIRKYLEIISSKELLRALRSRISGRKPPNQFRVNISELF